MTRSIFHQLSTLCFAAALCLGLTAPAFAEGEPEGWRLRLAGIYVDPDFSGTGTDDDGNPIQVEAKGDTGLSLRAEYRFSRRLGFELGLWRSNADFAVDFSGPSGNLRLVASPSMTPLTAGLLVHLLPDRSVDLYLAGRFAYVFYGDATLEEPGLGRQDFRADDDLSWSLALGADVPLGDGDWGLHFELAHLDTRLTLTNVDDGEVSDLEIDPLVVSAGVVYRF